jgi:hypothetical protein
MKVPLKPNYLTGGKVSKHLFCAFLKLSTAPSNPLPPVFKADEVSKLWSPEDPSCLLFQAPKLCILTVSGSHLGSVQWRGTY